MLNLLHNRTAQALSGWVTLLSALFAYLSGHTPEWFGHLTWPQATLTGIGFALASTLLMAIALALAGFGYRKVHPDQAVKSAELPDTISATGLITQRLEVVEASVRSVIEDYQRIFASEAQLSGDLDGLKTAIQDRHNNVEMAIKVVERKANEANTLSDSISQIRSDGQICLRDINNLNAVVQDHRKRATEAFSALRSIERLSTLSGLIKQDSADLYDRLRAGEIYDQDKWHQWENVHSHWNDMLSQWLDIATWYGLAIKERTLLVDEAKYGAAWTIEDNQFPGSEPARRFKKFRIIHTQWEAVLPDVQKGVELVAFSGMTELEVRNGRPAG